jgi:hypothetical protein
MRRVKRAKEAATKGLGKVAGGIEHGVQKTANLAQAAGGAVVGGAEAAAHAVGTAEGRQKLGGSIEHAGQAAVSGVSKAGHVVAAGAEAAAHAVGTAEGRQKLGGSIEHAGQAAVSGVSKAGHVVAAGAEAAAHAVGTAEGRQKLGDAAVKGVEGAAHTIKDTVVTGGRFIADSEYREKHAIPKMRASVREAGELIQEELAESEEMVRVLYRYGQGDALSDDETDAAKQQLADLAKVVGWHSPTALGTAYIEMML